jgi:hypothetical protein
LYQSKNLIEEIELTSTGILAYMQTLCENKTKGPSSLIVNPDVELVGRAKTIMDLRNHFIQLYASQVSLLSDRTVKKFPLVTSLPGMGKTRLFFEWQRFLPEDEVRRNILEKLPHLSGIETETVIPLIVTYGNGHAPQRNTVEPSLPVEASFAWRLLYSHFLEGYGLQMFPTTLPRNLLELNLCHAIETIRKDKNIEGRLLLVLGIDEYQAVRSLPSEDPTRGSALTILCDVLLSTMNDSQNVILPLLTGTRYGDTERGSSKAVCKYVPLPLLSLPEIMTAARSIPEWEPRLNNVTVCRHLFTLGGVPRYFVEYMRELTNGMTPADAFREIESSWPSVWSVLPIKKAVKLIAYSLSGQTVRLNETPNGFETSWRDLRDSCLCITSKESGGYVTIPYIVFYQVGTSTEPLDALSEPEQFLVLTIKQMISDVDERIAKEDPWKLWEVFGAYFYALRINSLMVLGHTRIELRQILFGADINGIKYRVNLQPMLVKRSSVEFSQDFPKKITDADGETFQWKGEQGKGFIWLNASNGEGIDIFFALSQVSKQSKYVICLDQRKRMALTSVTENNVATLLDAANIRPKNCASDILVRGVSHMLAAFEGELPRNCFVVRATNSAFFHQSLAGHPATCLVNMNTAPPQILLILLNNNPECVQAVCEVREKEKFGSKKRFDKWVRQAFPNM